MSGPLPVSVNGFSLSLFGCGRRLLWVMVAKRRAGFWFLLAMLWLGLVGFVSLNPAPPGLETLDSVASWFPFPEVVMSVLQAVIHMFLFGIWAVLWAKTLASVFPSASALRIFLFSIAVVLVVGVAIEIMQIWIPNRAASSVDLSGDMVGAVLFLSVWQSNFIGRFAHRFTGPRTHEGVVMEK